MSFQVIGAACIVILLVIVARTAYVIYDVNLVARRKKARPRLPHGTGVATLVVLGSGGHTTEILHLLEKVPVDTYRPRHYVVASTDSISATKAAGFEASRNPDGLDFVVHRIPRSREVRQSFVTSVFSTLWATVHAVGLVWRIFPDLIVCNGPGTCVPIVASALLLKIIGIKDPAVVYVESFARVRSLSLTGKILYPLVDRFVVLWPELAARYPKASYVGRLV
ncbi:UDP-N-acetylglucosamine transferase subunit ALG14 [Hyaloraphidium curvatum]|nr:UDP-N-acetylglucosamine transferase subunit ALG14 [Hyaloraphidium curvatum]